MFRIAHALGLEIADLVPAWPEWVGVGAPGEGARTRERRRAMEISLAELAARAGVSEATLSRHERARTQAGALAAGDATGARSRLARALGFADEVEFGRHCAGLTTGSDIGDADDR